MNKNLFSLCRCRIDGISAFLTGLTALLTVLKRVRTRSGNLISPRMRSYSFRKETFRLRASNRCCFCYWSTNRCNQCPESSLTFEWNDGFLGIDVGMNGASRTVLTEAPFNSINEGRLAAIEAMSPGSLSKVCLSFAN